MVEFHQLAAAIYLAAGLGALIGVVLPSPRMSRGAAWGLALGALVQIAAFATLHLAETPRPITALPAAVELSAWMLVIYLLALMWKFRLPALAAGVGPVAFLAVFGASLGLESVEESALDGGGAWPHVHVLLATAGVGLLALAGIAGIFFLMEHRRLKAKHPIAPKLALPSLEALDRVNVMSTVLGFVLLSLGVMTGMFWLLGHSGEFWSGTSHETWMVIAWAIYAGLVSVRYLGRQGPRQAAASAMAGFVFLLFGIVGVGILG